MGHKRREYAAQIHDTVRELLGAGSVHGLGRSAMGEQVGSRYDELTSEDLGPEASRVLFPLEQMPEAMRARIRAGAGTADGSAERVRAG
jgi:hypothetical protein